MREIFGTQKAFIVKPTTILNFERRSDEGQMTVEERKLMYDHLIKYQCVKGVEVGTWRGGGSTYIIASAMERTIGLLYSFEVDQDAHEYARKLYQNELKYLEDRVILILGQTSDRIDEFVNQKDLDFLMLDGDDDSRNTLKQFESVNKYLKPNALIFCHDWTGSGKQHLTKPILTNKKKFEMLHESSVSTGFAIFRKI